MNRQFIKPFAVITLLIPLTMGCFMTRIARSFLAEEQETPVIEQPIEISTETPPEIIEPTEEIVMATNAPEVATPAPEITQGGASHEPICTNVEDLTICMPYGLADTLVVSTIPEVTADTGAPWEVGPEHYEIALQGYKISDAFWKPTISIYSIEKFQATAPDEINGQISQLNSLLAQKPTIIDQYPFLPSVNAGALIKARPFYYDEDYLDIRGYSMITQFGQSFWPINNKDMFYTFQGMTKDGKYWISMNLPITQQNLPSNGDYINNQDFEEFANTFQDYATQTREMLDQADSSTFTPSLEEFEMLVSFSFANN